MRGKSEDTGTLQAAHLCDRSQRLRQGLQRPWGRRIILLQDRNWEERPPEATGGNAPRHSGGTAALQRHCGGVPTYLQQQQILEPPAPAVHGLLRPAAAVQRGRLPVHTEIIHHAANRRSNGRPAGIELREEGAGEVMLRAGAVSQHAHDHELHRLRGCPALKPAPSPRKTR